MGVAVSQWWRALPLSTKALPEDSWQHLAAGGGASGDEHCACAPCVGTSEVTPGHRAGEAAPREEHSTLWVPEQRPWALSPSPTGPPTSCSWG